MMQLIINPTTPAQVKAAMEFMDTYSKIDAAAFITEVKHSEETTKFTSIQPDQEDSRGAKAFEQINSVLNKFHAEVRVAEDLTAIVNEPANDCVEIQFMDDLEVTAEETAKDEPELTLEEVRAELAAISKKTGAEAIKKIITANGSARLTELPTAAYLAVLTSARALIN